MKGELRNLLNSLACLSLVTSLAVQVSSQPPVLTLITTTPLASGTRSSAALAHNGTVYISSYYSNNGAAGGVLYSLTLTNGVFQTNWTFTAGSTIDASPTLAPDDSTVYIGSYDQNLYAINTSTGAGIWTNVTQGYVRTTPAIGNDGTVYFVQQSLNVNTQTLWQVTALSPSSGSVKWRFPSQTYPWLGTNYTFYGEGSANLAIGADGTIYAGCITVTNPCSSSLYDGLGILYAIGVTSGVPFLKWQYPPANSTGIELGGINTGPTLDNDGTIYFGTYADGDAGIASQVIALNADGSLKWMTNGAVGRFDSSAAVGPDGTLYIGEDSYNEFDPCNNNNVIGGVLFALSPVDGHTIWAITNTISPLTAPSSFLSSPAISADGTIYVGCDDLTVYALNSATGATNAQSAQCGWSSPFGTGNVGFESSPVIAPNGVVYIGCLDGNLYAFSYETNVGLASSFWPMFRENRRHSSDVVDNRWTELPFPSATIVALPYTGQAQGVVNWAVAYGINATNMIAGGNFGSFSGNTNEHMVYWYNGTIHDFSSLCQSKDAEGLAVNDAGLVVGWGDDCSGVQWAAWRSLTSSSVQELANPLSWSAGIAEGVNNPGQIVGYAKNLSSTNHAVYWSSTSATGSDLRTLAGNVGSDDSYAFGINNAGWIVGLSENSGGYYHGFLTLSNTALSSTNDIGTMSGTSSDYSVAYAINGIGQITGGSGTSSGATHAFLKSPFSGASAGYQDLGTLGFGSARGTTISGRGHVGGVMSVSSGGFLYVPGWANATNVYNFLSSSDKSNWTIKSVFGVNHQGWIVGWGLYGASQQKRAFVIYPNN